MRFPAPHLLSTVLAITPHLSHITALVITPRQSSPGLLFGPCQLPTGNIREIDIHLVTFNDEVFDISNIAIFGNVNDGCTDTTTSEHVAGEMVVVGPVDVGNSSEVDDGSVRIRLVTFGDEVFDVSGIAVLGDVNDGGC